MTEPRSVTSMREALKAQGDPHTDRDVMIALGLALDVALAGASSGYPRLPPLKPALPLKLDTQAGL